MHNIRRLVEAAAALACIAVVTLVMMSSSPLTRAGEAGRVFASPADLGGLALVVYAEDYELSYWGCCSSGTLSRGHCRQWMNRLYLEDKLGGGTIVYSVSGALGARTLKNLQFPGRIWFRGGQGNYALKEGPERVPLQQPRKTTHGLAIQGLSIGMTREEVQARIRASEPDGPGQKAMAYTSVGDQFTWHFEGNQLIDVAGAILELDGDPYLRHEYCTKAGLADLFGPPAAPDGKGWAIVPTASGPVLAVQFDSITDKVSAFRLSRR